MRLGSSSSSHACLNSFYLHTLYTTIFLLCNIITTYGFDNHMPPYGLSSNISRSFSTLVLNIDDFGAQGDGFTDDTKSFQDAWEVACSSSSPAKIVIPAGRFYLIRPTDFVGPCVSKLTLRVSGVIVAPKDPAAWDGLDQAKWLNISGVNHLRVDGGGVFDGMGMEWWARSCKTNPSNPCRPSPMALTFYGCRDLKVKHITFVNGPKFHVTFTQCTNVVASSITVIAPSDSPNTDGVHINASTHVRLKDIIASTGDDCISIVANCSNIRIKNVFCGPGHGISIGSMGKFNATDVIYDVSVNNAIMVNTDNGVRIKTWQGGSGMAKKIKFENIWMNNVSNPIIINQYYCDSPLPCANQTSAVILDRITFRGIKGTTPTKRAIKMTCSDSHPCKRIHLENIQLTSLNGSAVKSFCWNAHISRSHNVYPPPCL
ncbi:hypothetical protein ACS0TY_034969 [Phlomoides rotata]